MVARSPHPKRAIALAEILALGQFRAVEIQVSALVSGLLYLSHPIFKNAGRHFAFVPKDDIAPPILSDSHDLPA